MSVQSSQERRRVARDTQATSQLGARKGDQQQSHHYLQVPSRPSQGPGVPFQVLQEFAQRPKFVAG